MTGRTHLFAQGVIGVMGCVAHATLGNLTESVILLAVAMIMFGMMELHD